MTQREIIARWHNLTPQERDEWIDADIMGHTAGETCNGGPVFCGDTAGDWCCIECGASGHWGEDDPDEHQRVPPVYTTTWDGAGRVVERMRERYGNNGHNGFMISQRDNEPWYCEFSQPQWEYAEADTMPAAVCLAALLTTAEG